MKKTIVIICTVLSALMILDSMYAGEALMMFLLAGVIPGTNITISAQHMMEAFALLMGFVIARLSNRFVQPLIARLPLGRVA